MHRGREGVEVLNHGRYLIEFLCRVYGVGFRVWGLRSEVVEVLVM